MKTYLVTLIPQEPYFFGNEKTFLFDRVLLNKDDPENQRGNSYYIRSERTPLQSTLMGMLRYILMPYKDYTHQNENKLIIGCESFKIDAENQCFGMIKKIYPLFIMHQSEKLVVTPFDCKTNVKIYTSFSNYQTIKTENGEKLFTPDYDPKKGLVDSYMSISDKSLTCCNDIFGTETRVGNRKTISGKKEKDFFKKEYIYLNTEYSFAFYVDLDDRAMLPKSRKTQVFLGQGKSLFTVFFEKQANTLQDEVRVLIPDNIFYCLSDVFVDSEILDYCKFSIIQTRDYRAYMTKPNGTVKKDSTLYKLVKAGSVFQAADKERFIRLINKPNCQLAGFNHIIAKEKY